MIRPGACLGSLSAAIRHPPASTCCQQLAGRGSVRPPGRLPSGRLPPARQTSVPRQCEPGSWLRRRCYASGPALRTAARPGGPPPQTAVRKDPDSGVSVGLGSLHFISPASTSRWSADCTSFIPFRLTTAAEPAETGALRSLAALARLRRIDLPSLRAEALWPSANVAVRKHPPQIQTGFASALWSPWHDGLLHFPQPQELLCPKPPQSPAPADAGPRRAGDPAGSRLPRHPAAGPVHWT